MSGVEDTTIIGNLTADPELRFTPSGRPVANFTVARTPRKFNKDRNEWEDGVTLFMPVSAWGDLGENVAATLAKGMRVIVVGALTQANWQDKATGGNRSRVELNADSVGPDLRNATAVVTRAARGGATAPAPAGAAANANAWGAPPAPPAAPWGGNGGGSDEPPF